MGQGIVGLELGQSQVGVIEWGGLRSRAWLGGFPPVDAVREARVGGLELLLEGVCSRVETARSRRWRVMRPSIAPR